MSISSDTAPPIGPDQPWLAPLAGFSDLPLRMLCREYGAAVACTEMVSAKGLVYGGEGSWDLVHSIPAVPEDSPLVVQIFGAEVDFVREAVLRLLHFGARYFDLNAGCSVKKVVKTGAGAALLDDSARMAKILRAMVDVAGEGRVGVKIRSGWRVADFVSGAASRLESLGLGWIALHPRSAGQGFSGRADWSHFRLLRERVRDVPLLASGDLHTAADGRDCLAGFSADGVMYARGALANPAIFRDHHRIMQDGADRSSGTDSADRLEVARRHVHLCRRYADSRKNLLKMRTVLPKYLKGFREASAVRSRLVRASSWEEIESLLEGLARE